jgi:hypothetical protein
MAAPPAMPMGAAAAKAPPLLLPGEHFAAALFFLLAGSIGLIAIGPALASGAYVSPRAAGVTHLFTLGWITTSIMGALYQFLPVALGEPIRSQRVAHTSFVLHAPGLALFVTGLLSSETTLMLTGAACFGTGILLFTINLAVTLKAAGRRDVTWWALAFADAYLFATLCIGIALAGNLRWGYLGAGRLNAMAVHIHIAVAGWVLLVMIGVAQRLLPMFLLSHGAGDRSAKVAVALVASGAGVLTFLHHAPVLISRWLPALLIGGGCVAFLLQARAFYRHRVRPNLDPGMRLAAISLGVIVVALVVAWPVVAGVAQARHATAYVLTLLLGISLFVVAHYYKIVPFLIWYHRFGPLAGRQEVPRVGELYSARLATVAGGVLVAATALLIAGIALGAGAIARAGGIAFTGGVMVTYWQMLKLARTRP